MFFLVVVVAPSFCVLLGILRFLSCWVTGWLWFAKVESGTMGIEFLASMEKGYHVTVLDSVLMHWRMGGSSSSTSDFLVFHVMTNLSFFLYRKRKCTKRVGQKKNWVIKLCISYEKTCVAHWKLTIVVACKLCLLWQAVTQPKAQTKYFNVIYAV